MEQPVPLSEISLPSSEYGTLSWADESSVPSERVQSYDVVFRPYNAADLSKISGWDGSSDVIYSSVRVVVSGIEENESQEEEWSEENNGEAPRIRMTASGKKKTAARERMTVRNQKITALDPQTKMLESPSQMDRKMTEQRRILSRTVNGDSADKGNMNLAETARQRAASRMETAILQKRITARNRRIRMPVLRMKMPVTPMENGETEEESQQDGDSNPAEGESQDNAGDKEDMPEAGEKPEPTVTPEATVTPEVSDTGTNCNPGSR